MELIKEEETYLVISLSFWNESMEVIKTLYGRKIKNYKKPNFIFLIISFIPTCL